MKIAMLARNANLYSHQRLVEAAKTRGHEIDVLNTLRVTMNITSHRPEAFYNGTPLTGYDAVIPRIGGLDHLLRPRRAAPVRDDGRVVAERMRRDRPLARQAALDAAPRARGPRPAGHRLRPRSTEADRRRCCKMVGGAPLVIKLLEGTQGIGVVLGETEPSRPNR